MVRFVRQGVHLFASFSSLWAAVTRMHINALSIMKVYIERNNKHVELIRFRKKIASILTMETLTWEYSFATAVFTKLGSLLSGTSRHCTVLGAPDVSDMTTSVHAISGHSHFGTCHIGTSTIRDCITVLFQVTMYRQFARKVGQSANLALIRYSSLRL